MRKWIPYIILALAGFIIMPDGEWYYRFASGILFIEAGSWWQKNG